MELNKIYNQDCIEYTNKEYIDNIIYNRINGYLYE